MIKYKSKYNKRKLSFVLIINYTFEWFFQLLCNVIFQQFFALLVTYRKWAECIFKMNDSDTELVFLFFSLVFDWQLRRAGLLSAPIHAVIATQAGSEDMQGLNRLQVVYVYVSVSVCVYLCSHPLGGGISVYNPLNRSVQRSCFLSASTLSFYANAAVYCPEHWLFLSGPALTDHSLTASMCVSIVCVQTLLLMVRGPSIWPPCQVYIKLLILKNINN